MTANEDNVVYFNPLYQCRQEIINSSMALTNDQYNEGFNSGLGKVVQLIDTLRPIYDCLQDSTYINLLDKCREDIIEMSYSGLMSRFYKGLNAALGESLQIICNYIYGYGSRGIACNQ